MDPLVEHHFYNIANDKAVKNEDGTLSTVRGTIVEIDGIQTLIPTIWDGKEVDTQTAIQNAQKSGVNWQRAFGDNAIETLRDIEIDGKKRMSDQTTPEEAQSLLDTYYEDIDGIPEAERVGLRDVGKLGLMGVMLGGQKLGFNMGPVWDSIKGKGFALGGLATATKGITTQEGKDMAAKKFQRDDKKADTNKDGMLSPREKEVGDATQKTAMKMYHGGMPCGCGGDCDGSCEDMSNGIMGYDDVSGNPIPIGSSATNVRDDIEAMISEGEYVLPAHVVSWHGLKHIKDMQAEAEMGLMSMEMDGLIQHVEEKSNSKSSEDTEVSDEGDTQQEEAYEEVQASEEIPSEEMDIEVAAVEVDDQLDDTDDIEEMMPVSKTLPGMLKKQKIAFMV